MKEPYKNKVSKTSSNKAKAQKLRSKGFSMRQIQKKIGYKSVNSVEHLLKPRRITKVEEAILHLADCIQEGSWQGVYKDIVDILKPPFRRPKIEALPPSPKRKK